MMSDWPYERLDNLGNTNRPALKAGPFGSSVKKESYVNSGYKVYGQQEVLSGNIKAKSYYIDKETFERHKSCSVEAGDILITMMGTVGKVLVIPRKHEAGIINPRLMRISLDTSRVNPEFVKVFLTTPKIQNLIERRAHGGTMPGLNTEAIGSIKIPIPGLEFQNYAIKFLQTWDTAIEKTEALLAAKERQFGWFSSTLIDRILPIGGLRTLLSDIYEFKRGAGLSKADIIETGSNKCILYGQLYTTYGEVIKRVISRTDKESGMKSVAGDVLIPASTTTSAIDLANVTALLEDNILLSGDINILRPKSERISSEFMAYYLTHYKKHDLARLAQGITIIHLYGKDIKTVSVSLPDISIQHKVVSLLNTARREIDLLKELADQYRTQKRGLMQKLLSGEWHIKNKDSV